MVAEFWTHPYFLVSFFESLLVDLSWGVSLLKSVLVFRSISQWRYFGFLFSAFCVFPSAIDTLLLETFLERYVEIITYFLWKPLTLLDLTSEQLVQGSVE